MHDILPGFQISFAFICFQYSTLCSCGSGYGYWLHNLAYGDQVNLQNLAGSSSLLTDPKQVLLVIYVRLSKFAKRYFKIRITLICKFHYNLYSRSHLLSWIYIFLIVVIVVVIVLACFNIYTHQFKLIDATLCLWQLVIWRSLMK